MQAHLRRLALEMPKREEPSDRPRSNRRAPKLNRAALERDVRALGADVGSVFLLDDDGVSLVGAPGAWDWTRSGFRVRLDLWPTVQRAVVGRRIVLITEEQAQELERDWFEPSGISSCVCAPLVGAGRVLGVFFADTLQSERSRAHLDLSLVRRVAMRWAAELLDALRASADLSTEKSGVRLRRDVLTAPSLMGTGDPPTVARAHESIGAVTREDLQSAGFLPEEPPHDVCAACGDTEGLAPRSDGEASKGALLDEHRGEKS
jgi:hypothetical protein